ncbi:beta-galactosidase [Fodinicola acaciae]|uniref:beta-galactosidase n=1 Tax=Fodinicola acaciae TaxID=2681555 RepID=UPI0013D4DBEC|nr:beta-galactosidase [Fodinicola acaciae]
MRSRSLVVSVILLLFGALLPGTFAAAAAPPKHTITWDHYSLSIDGRRTFVYSGEVHPFRLPSPSLWPDVLAKMRAAGFTTVTAYFDWGYASPAPGVYDFSGIRDVGRFLRDAANAGLYVIARPGPYINAEADGGGFPGWLARMAGTPRSSDPRYLAYAKEWLHAIDPIIAAHQLTDSTGTVIATQVENEIYNSDTADGRDYMAALQAQMRADGITVPLTGNNNTDYVNGTGSVQLPGHDRYPLGFDCSNPTVWPGQVEDQFGLHDYAPNSPLFFPEFQGGAFDPWGGAGYDKCRQLTNDQFEKVYYGNSIAAGSTMMNFYMTYGGTSWGFLPCTCVYSSYDYGSAISESRQVETKYNQQKLIAQFLRSAPSLTKTDQLAVRPPTSTGLTVLGRANPDDGFQLLTLRHADTRTNTPETTHISVDLAARTAISNDDAGNAIAYAGDWTHAAKQNYTAGDYGNTESFASASGASASFTFGTNTVRVVGAKGSNGGIAEIFLDGAKVATVDTYAPGNREYQQIYYQARGLTGRHTVTIVATGAKNPASSGTFVPVDGIDAYDSTATDDYPTVPQQAGTAVTVGGRDSQLLVANYRFGDQRLAYSTSQLVTATPGMALFYGVDGSDGETVLRYPGKPHVRVLAGKAASSWDPARGDLRLNYVHSGLTEVLVSGGGRAPVRLLFGDTTNALTFWPDGPVLTRGPYLVRSADVRGRLLRLRGDTSAPTDVQVFAPANVSAVSWNDRPTGATRQADGSLTFRTGGPPAVTLPRLDNWKFAYESTERQPDFDDSGWLAADHTTTDNPNAPGSLPVLYADDYGFHTGDVWYRGHFNGNAAGITIDGQGGSPAGTWSAWLNGALLGTQASGSRTFTLPAGLLRKENVVSVVVHNAGHEECGAPCGSFLNPRGIRTAKLTGSATTISWKIQGNLGGEQPVDRARGPLNTGGLYGERHGWSLPGYPDDSWQKAALPDHWQDRGLPAGVGWYRAGFDLHLPAGTDIPLGLRLDDNPVSRYRAEIFVNGWLLGLYANDLGPQHTYSLPPGILNANGHNTIAIAVTGADNSGGLGSVRLVPYGAYAGGVPVSQVPAPAWNAHTYGSPAVPGQLNLALSGTTQLLRGGESFTVTGKVSNTAATAANGTQLRLTAPTGWSVTPDGVVDAGNIKPGGQASVRWTVRAPENLATGSYQVAATVTSQSGAATAGTATFAVPYAKIADTFDNKGISDDARPTAADFDGAGYSFSAQALAAAGLAPGASVRSGNIAYGWPSAAAGQPDNTAANGQIIALNGKGASLGFLGASNSGSPRGLATVFYADGSSQTVTIGLDDFWFDAGGSNIAVANLPYLNSPTGHYDHTVHVFAATAPIDASKQVVAVRLPAISAGSQGHSTAMHVFAIGVG